MTHQPQSDDLCVLQDVKNYLFRGGSNETIQTDDDMLQRMITAVSDFMRKEASTAFSVQEHMETRNGSGQRMLFLKYTPCTAVASLYVDGVLVSARGQAPTNFGSSGYIFNDDHITLHGYIFNRGKDNVQVTYTAGYSQIPRDLEQSVVVTIARKYREIERLGHMSKSIAGETVSFDLSDLDDFAQRTIDRYKRVIPV